jgi:lysophospholipase L1-like esterase
MAPSLFRYVALGDSTSVGVGAAADGGYPERIYQRLKAAGVPAGILNLGQSGATTREVVAGPVQKAVEVRPALVTLAVGTNDLWRMVPVGTFESQLKSIGTQLEKTGATVLVSNLIDLSLAPISALVESALRIPRTTFNQRISEFNDRLALLCRRHKFQLVDLFAVSQRELRGATDFFAADGFHPSAKGYERWAQEVWPHAEASARAWQAARPPDDQGST